MGDASVCWTDTHCHLQDTYAREGQELSVLLDRAENAAVLRAICIGTGLEASREAIALARGEHDLESRVALWASVGLHPHEASEPTGPIAALLDDAMTQQGTSRAPGSVVAVGECGLDYFYEHSPKSAQRTAFSEQVALARRHDLTLVVHTRDTWEDTYAIVANDPPSHVVIHCFTGGPTEADRLLELGCYLSFSGIVTFKNADPTRQAAAACPSDRILVETDSPFLAPVPYSGSANEPAHVGVVGAFLAELRGVTVAEFASTTTANAEHAFAFDV